MSTLAMLCLAALAGYLVGRLQAQGAWTDLRLTERPNAALRAFEERLRTMRERVAVARSQTAQRKGLYWE